MSCLRKLLIGLVQLADALIEPGPVAHQPVNGSGHGQQHNADTGSDVRQGLACERF